MTRSNLRIGGAGTGSPNLRETTEFARIAFDLAGLNLNPEKLEFFAQRLAKRVAATGTQSYSNYLTFLRHQGREAERTYFVEALTTHTTSFFREQRHYTFLTEKGLPELVQNGAGTSRALTIWSAACSNGAELYSALMCAVEFGESKGKPLKAQGVGTDISGRILRRCKDATYSKDEISGLSEDRRRRFLLRHREGKPIFRIGPELRSLCNWSLCNLTEQSIRGPRSVDVIFLRNVLIYFDSETQRRVVENLSTRLTEGGFLFTGHSEALSRLPDTMLQRDAAIYQRGFS